MKIKKLTNLLIFVCLVLSLVFVFSSCDKSKEDPTEAPTSTEAECSHTNTEYEILKAASCTEKGSSKKVCLDCNAVIETVELDMVAHTEVIIEGKAPSCSAEGLTEGKKCSVCDAILIKQESINRLNHTEVIIESVAATCTNAGSTAGKKCSACSTVIVAPEIIPQLSHVESDWIIDKAAEVGVVGQKHTECTLCKLSMKSETIPALSEEHIHAGSSWVVKTPSTCSAEGEKALICECGKEMETAKLEKIAHTEEKVLGTAPTCTSTGLTDGKKCSVCGAIIVAQETIAKANHTEEIILGVAPTCTEYGKSDGKRCSVCTEILEAQIPIPPTGHSFTSGTCSGCGLNRTYGIWLVDGLGNPVSNVIIKILKDGEQVKMYPYQGTYLSFDLDVGTYTIELDLSQTGKNYVYDTSLCTITPDNRHAAIKLYETVSDKTSVFVGYPIEKDYNAYEIKQGSYQLTLKPNDYTFLIFRPTAAAIYTLTYECDSELKISYHGSSFFVQGSDLSESSNDIGTYENGLFANIYPSNIGGDFVFAIKSESATTCILNIANAGDPGTRLEDEPWTPYLEEEEKVAEQLAADKTGTYTVIDVTDTSIKAVFNEDDGYYHLGTTDGPVIFIDLTSDSRFISSIQTICANQRMGSYIKDVNGNISEKRSYNELFMQYGMPGTTEKVDEPIRVPLTEKLAEAIKGFGDKNSWWAEGSDSNIFERVLLGAPYNREYAWLLYCGYYK